jgi:hypothetical protein
MRRGSTTSRDTSISEIKPTTTCTDTAAAHKFFESVEDKASSAKASPTPALQTANITSSDNVEKQVAQSSKGDFLGIINFNFHVWQIFFIRNFLQQLS